MNKDDERWIINEELYKRHLETKDYSHKRTTVVINISLIYSKEQCKSSLPFANLLEFHTNVDFSKCQQATQIKGTCILVSLFYPQALKTKFNWTTLTNFRPPVVNWTVFYLLIFQLSTSPQPVCSCSSKEQYCYLHKAYTTFKADVFNWPLSFLRFYRL